MNNTRAALRYAKAILSLAIDNKVEDKVNEDMKLIASTIIGSNDLDMMLKSPVVKLSEKIKVLEALFTSKIDTITNGVFNVLQENKRVEMLELVAEKYSIIYEQYKNTQVAKVTTAVALTKELENKIQDKIVALTGNKATIENSIDSSILGGFILQVGDKQFDASITTKFNILKKEFLNSY